jgi:membrane AbrB-like protein
MLAGMLTVAGGASMRISPWLLNFSQALLGCLIARSLTPDIVAEVGRQWPLFLGIISLIVFASAALGWLISKLRILPSTTAVWGLLPGAAPVMILMAEASGADSALVGAMQYMRMVCVAVTASITARFWVHIPAAADPTTIWFPSISWLPFIITLLIIGTSLIAVLAPRIPAGVFFAAMLIGGILHLGDPSVIELPPWLLAIAYALLGWNTGFKFTRKVIGAAVRALPQIIAAILTMIVFCAGLAAILVHVLGVDPLTAYLATSPGGIDSVAVIAATTKVDAPFVMSLQTVRFLLILMLGPSLAKFTADLVDAKKGVTAKDRGHVRN